MKIKRVNLPEDSEQAHRITYNYLQQTYNIEELFRLDEKTYEGIRTQESEELETSIDETTMKLRQISNKNIAWDMFLSLSVGVKEAAPYLAESLRLGYGTNKEYFLSTLTLFIGHELGDPRSSHMLEIVGLSGYARADIRPLASRCASKITANAKEIGCDAISYEIWAGYAKDLDKLVKANSKHSYCDNIFDGAMKLCANYIEVDYSGSSDTGLAGAEHNSNSCCTIL